MSESSEEKEFAPSERRLQQARERGELPLGRDLLAAGSLGGLTLALFVFPDMIPQIAGQLSAPIRHAPDMASSFVQESPSALTAFLTEALKPIIPLFLFPALLVVGLLFAQRGLVFAPQKLEPKLNRISPLAGVKKKFGRAGLFEFAKSLLKILLIGFGLWTYLGYRAEQLIAAMGLAPVQTLGLLARLLLEFLMIAVVMQLAIGMLDLLWQRMEHLRQHRMTRKEMTDEMKDADGDPHMKGRRRQRAQEIAQGKMLKDVASAHVVIVNPEHYAVALRWTRASAGAPLCVAKGVDELALQIRERARQAGVPIRRDPPTARALYAAVKVGEEIQPEHYRAVAAAIRFAEAIRRHAPRKTGSRRNG